MTLGGAHRVATAFSPASVGNFAVGFDILGHSLMGPGDKVTVSTIAERTVRVAEIRGLVTELPTQAERNTAGAALLALARALDLPFGFELRIEKGLALGSGMGGSAASCVAALVAANSLLDEPLRRDALYPYALIGESIASGGAHGDNVGPQLIGGLALCTPERVLRLPVPPQLYCALVHPDAVLETRRAREVLRGSYLIGDFVAQSANLARVLAGCYRHDLTLIKAGLADVLVEPRRAALIPGFASVKAAALSREALGASISGAGPSVVAWFDGRARAEAALPAMREAFAAAGLASEGWVSPVDGPAAELVDGPRALLAEEDGSS
jgi:homoserine kinase